MPNCQSVLKRVFGQEWERTNTVNVHHHRKEIGKRGTKKNLDSKKPKNKNIECVKIGGDWEQEIDEREHNFSLFEKKVFLGFA